MSWIRLIDAEIQLAQKRIIFHKRYEYGKHFLQVHRGPRVAIMNGMVDELAIKSLMDRLS